MIRSAIAACILCALAVFNGQRRSVAPRALRWSRRAARTQSVTCKRPALP